MPLSSRYVSSLRVLPRIPWLQKKSFFGGFWGGGESDGLKKCWRKVISAQCSECHSGANSNKRGCGPPVKAQATARVDVPTARVFPAWPKESNTSASFCCERLDMCTAGNRP